MKLWQRAGVPMANPGVAALAPVMALIVAFAASLACIAPAFADSKPKAEPDPEVIVVGASLAGLSATIDLARSGVHVLVIDMNSVFGGHAIQTGGVAVIGSPMQEAMGFHDTPEQAYRDWSAWTTDPNEEWIRYYVTHSRTDIYDFLTSIGVTFDRVAASHGNSIPRFHMTHRRGLNLVRPLFREALRYPNVKFRWNTEATALLMKDGKISGVRATDLRAQQELTLVSSAVVLGTGGFQRNIDKVRKHWPADMPVPPRLLTGSGKYSLGIGLDMAEAVGAADYRIDRQYNNYSAIPDPRDPTGALGLSAGNAKSIWVNAEGRRFVNPDGFDKDVYPKVLQQTGSTYWAIFDSQTKSEFKVGNADWNDRPILAAQVLENADLVKTAASLAQLAQLTHLPAAALEQTVRRYNELVAAGEDSEFGSFTQSSKSRPAPIAVAPFYAVQFYPMAHKNMGGVAIDIHAQVLDKQRKPIPGLYAGGEITGSAGINGMAGLDGTFTGPSILVGRVAGQSAAAQIIGQKGSRARVAPQSAVDPAPAGNAPAVGWFPTMNAAQLQELVRTPRDGYWHFEQVHKSVLQRELPCNECHSALVPQTPARDVATMRALTETCDQCHRAPISK
ncbi:MAG TPA: FAD-binding protein [Steroidobacteraceae bacterium]|jgi:predicted oxidoreductase